MSLLDNIWIKLTADFVGVDESGNKYYSSHKVDYLGRKRRYVIYNIDNDPSAISPAWHMWLHHLADNAPQTRENSFVWQKPRIPNSTGTKMAYHPLGMNCCRRKNVSADYEKWQPNK